MGCQRFLVLQVMILQAIMFQVWTLQAHLPSAGEDAGQVHRWLGVRKAGLQQRKQGACYFIRCEGGAHVFPVQGQRAAGRNHWGQA